MYNTTRHNATENGINCNHYNITTMKTNLAGATGLDWTFLGKMFQVLPRLFIFGPALMGCKIGTLYIV